MKMKIETGYISPSVNVIFIECEQNIMAMSHVAAGAYSEDYETITTTFSDWE